MDMDFTSVSTEEEDSRADAEQFDYMRETPKAYLINMHAYQEIAMQRALI